MQTIISCVKTITCTSQNRENPEERKNCVNLQWQLLEHSEVI